jgi:hypothetical protein
MQFHTGAAVRTAMFRLVGVRPNSWKISPITNRQPFLEVLTRAMTEPTVRHIPCGFAAKFHSG